MLELNKDLVRQHFAHEHSVDGMVMVKVFLAELAASFHADNGMLGNMSRNITGLHTTRIASLEGTIDNLKRLIKATESRIESLKRHQSLELGLDVANRPDAPAPFKPVFPAPVDTERFKDGPYPPELMFIMNVAQSRMEIIKAIKWADRCYFSESNDTTEARRAEIFRHMLSNPELSYIATDPFNTNVIMRPNIQYALQYNLPHPIREYRKIVAYRTEGRVMPLRVDSEISVMQGIGAALLEASRALYAYVDEDDIVKVEGTYDRQHRRLSGIPRIREVLLREMRTQRLGSGIFQALNVICYRHDGTPFWLTDEHTSSEDVSRALELLRRYPSGSVIYKVHDLGRYIDPHTGSDILIAGTCVGTALNTPYIADEEIIRMCAGNHVLDWSSDD